jgi:hypothetical protein
MGSGDICFGRYFSRPIFLIFGSGNIFSGRNLLWAIFASGDIFFEQFCLRGQSQSVKFKNNSRPEGINPSINIDAGPSLRPRKPGPPVSMWYGRLSGSGLPCIMVHKGYTGCPCGREYMGLAYLTIAYSGPFLLRWHTLSVVHSSGPYCGHVSGKSQLNLSV